MNAAQPVCFEHLADLLAATLGAGRALGRRSLAHAWAGGGWPAQLALGSVRAEFRYATQPGPARGGGLRLLGAGDRPRDATRRPGAELTLRLGLTPALAGRVTDLAHPALELAAPEFLARPGEAGQLSLGLADGGSLTVAFPAPGRLRLAGADLTLYGDDGFAADYQGDTLAGWPVARLVAVLDTLAAWRRAGEPRRVLPFTRPGSRTGLGRLLEELARGYTQVARLLAADAATAPADRLAMSSGLSLDSLEADARLLLDDSGDLLDDAAEPNRQRVDMRASLRGTATGPVITLAPRFSDIGVAGGVLAEYLLTLRREAAIGAIWSGLARGHDTESLDLHVLPAAVADWSRARLAAYLRDPAHDRAATLARARHDDTDLVLLGPTPGEPGLRLLLQVTLPDPASARLAALRTRAGAWVTGDENLAPRYFHRLFQTLGAWQSGLASEVP